MSLTIRYCDIKSAESKKESEILKSLGIKQPIPTQEGYNNHGYKAHDVYLKSLTPEQAKDLLAGHRYDNNRKVDEGWVEELMEVNERGPEVSIGYIEETKDYIIANGHHNLLAAANKTAPVQMALSVFACQTLKAFANLYNSYDSHRRRSYQTCLENYKNMTNTRVMANNGEDEIPNNLLAQIGSSIRNAMQGFNKKSVSNSKKVEDAISSESVAFAKFLGDRYFAFFHDSGKIFGRNASRVLPNAILAAFYAMKTSDPKRADQFIAGYFRQIQISPNDPANVLSIRIMNRPASEHAACAYLTFVRAAHVCWKAFKEGRTDVKSDDLTAEALRGYKVPSYDGW